jgi:serine/threonine protein kinase
MDYIAPEQTRDALKVDVRADIYGLGCTLFFGLTGQPPFPGGTSKEKMQRHRRDEPPSLVTLNPQIPAEFAQIVDRMMAKNPDDRYPTAKAAGAALQKWADTEPALPLDRQGDPSYEEAVQTLTRAKSDTAIIYEAIPVADPVASRLWPPLLARWIDNMEESERGYLYFGLGVIGFWLLLLLVLALVLILR